MDVLLSDLRAQVLLANATGKPVRICGGGSKQFYGMPAKGGMPLELASYAGIVDYQPSEMVMTARAGTTLAEIECALAGEGQMLAFEPPHFAPGATLGGCVASALAGPRRASSGGVRDFVLGARLLDAQGRVLRFGGEVMKNVAGYDVSRLLAGSLGTLGVIVEASLKVVPRPEHERTLRFDAGQAQALARMTAWRGQALPISASAWDETGDGRGRLTVRLSGSLAAVDAASRKLGGDQVDRAEAGSWWRSLRDHFHPFLTQRPLWRISLPATAPMLDRGPTLIEWGGAQRWLSGSFEPQALRREVAALGGHATLFRCVSPAQAIEAGVFHPLPAVLAALHRRLKNEFDPEGIFNRGRMYPDL